MRLDRARRLPAACSAPRPRRGRSRSAAAGDPLEDRRGEKRRELALSLDAVRARIDAIDAELLRLVDERASLATRWPPPRRAGRRRQVRPAPRPRGGPAAPPAGQPRKAAKPGADRAHLARADGREPGAAGPVPPGRLGRPRPRPHGGAGPPALRRRPAAAPGRQAGGGPGRGQGPGGVGVLRADPRPRLVGPPAGRAEAQGVRRPALPGRLGPAPGAGGGRGRGRAHRRRRHLLGHRRRRTARPRSRRPWAATASPPA